MSDKNKDSSGTVPRAEYDALQSQLAGLKSEMDRRFAEQDAMVQAQIDPGAAPDEEKVPENWDAVEDWVFGKTPEPDTAAFTLRPYVEDSYSIALFDEKEVPTSMNTKETLPGVTMQFESGLLCVTPLLTKESVRQMGQRAYDGEDRFFVFKADFLDAPAVSVSLKDLGEFNLQASMSQRALSLLPEYRERLKSLSGASHAAGNLDEAIEQAMVASEPIWIREGRYTIAECFRQLGSLPEHVMAGVMIGDYFRQAVKVQYESRKSQIDQAARVRARLGGMSAAERKLGLVGMSNRF